MLGYVTFNVKYYILCQIFYKNNQMYNCTYIDVDSGQKYEKEAF